MVSRNLRVLSGLLAVATTFACAQTEKKKEETTAATTNTPTTTTTSTSGNATGTKTTTKTSTSTVTSTSTAKKLVGPFSLSVVGQFFGKAFNKNNFAYTFKDGATDFPILPDNIKSLSGVKTITYTVTSNKINVVLNRDSSSINIVMALTWSSDDAFKATKQSCDAGGDLIGGVACSQLTQLDISGTRQASTKSTATETATATDDGTSE